MKGRGKEDDAEELKKSIESWTEMSNMLAKEGVSVKEVTKHWKKIERSSIQSL